MTLTNHEICAPVCAHLADLKKKRRAIEDRRAAKKQVGVNSPDDDAADTDQLQPLDAEIARVQQALKLLSCDCDEDAADGGASPVLNPASPGSNP